MHVNRGPAALARLLDALGEPTRRRIYEAVRAARRPLSRAEAAEMVQVSTRLAAFHLDRLVEEGFLTAHYARPPGRRGGPGAGRTAKWYTPTTEGLEVTVPPRRNDVAARILLRALLATAEATGDDSTIRASARKIGHELARDCEGDDELEALLTDLGYEPSPGVDGGTDLVNCPFHELLDEGKEAVCTMNHAMLTGAASEAHSARVASLQPRDGLCCVRLLPTRTSTLKA